MRSAKLEQMLRLSPVVPIVLLFGLSACATPIVIPHAAGKCSDLVPADWWDPTPGADLPGLDATATDWQVFGNQQTGQLDKANLDKKRAHQIITGCEERDEKIVAAQSRKWWEIWK